MKRLFIIIALLAGLALGGLAPADQRILSSEEMVGSGHASKADTLNRLGTQDHDNDGLHYYLGSKAGLDLQRKDADEVYVDGGWREIAGKSYYLASQVAVTCSGLGADENWYLTVSAPGSGRLLSASDFACTSTAPTLTQAKGGRYYNAGGTARYIGWMLTDGSSNLIDFTKQGDTTCLADWQDGTFLDTGSPASSKTAIATGAPALGRLLVQVRYYAVTGEIALAGGDAPGSFADNEFYQFAIPGGLAWLMTDSSQQIYYRTQSAPAQTVLGLSCVKDDL